MPKFSLFTFFFFAVIAFGQEIASTNTIPWEQDDIQSVAKIISEKQATELASQQSTALALIRYYQKNVSVHSISRCPFKTSCSHFATQALQKNGFWVGSAMFIDRYFYRENISVYVHYPFFEDRKGILKLNDDFYLTGLMNSQ